jgi:MerR family copper efflux transcriptional regulator
MTMPESLDEELTIGALAGRFGLATHVLRHWEAMGLLTPETRVSGRRRYRRAHVARVAMIVRGKEAGFSLRQLRGMLDAPDADARRVLLERHHAELERRIAHIEASKAMIEHALVCPAKDITHCPDFQRLVEMVAARPPRQTTVISRPHPPLPLGEPGHGGLPGADQLTAGLDINTPQGYKQVKSECAAEQSGNQRFE